MTLLAAAALIALLVLCVSPAPGRTLRAFFLGPWSQALFAGNTLDGMALLLTASLGAAVSFRAGTFNLGGEGQVYLGGLVSSALLLSLPAAAPAPAALTLAAFAAALAGGIAGGVPGFLKKRLAANELITSFLLSAALIPLADYLTGGPWRDKTGSLLAMPPLPESRILSSLLPPSSLNVSLLFALLLVAAFYVFIEKTTGGYCFRTAGAVPEFARAAGISPEAVWTPAMAASGALSGLAGFFAVSGTYHRCHMGFPGGLGWNGIAVALIAGNNPLALVPAAFLYSWLEAGSSAALLASGLNFEAPAFIRALVLLLAAARIALPGKQGERGKSAGEAAL
ncbi:MAG: ABC transporter permease [Treponematales bacterium]